MSQSDYTIADQDGASFLIDINAQLAAIVSNNSGATEPTTTYAYQWWADTSAGVLKQRNAANSAWITIGTLGAANLGLLALTGGTLTGALNEAQGADIASAGTVNLTTATGNYVHITGTTTITAITLAQGAERTVVFDGALTLTNGASLLLPSGANITTVAGDTAVFRGEAAGVVRCVFYYRKAGTSLNATASNTIAQLNTNVTVTDSGTGKVETTVDGTIISEETLAARKSTIDGGSTLYPEFKCRAWVNFNGTGTVAIRASGNVSSITDNGVGDYTVNFTTAMPDANYAISVSSDNLTNAAVISFVRSATAVPTVSAVRVGALSASLVAADSPYYTVAIFR
jgi:hypothetical protein